MPGVCPQCGIAYCKWKPDNNAGRVPESDELNDNFTVEPVLPLRQRLKQRLLEVPEQVQTIHWWGRLLLLCVLTFWGSYFAMGGINWESIGGSFMHNINLPFHEFGHVLFSPFGNFMMILGGSLFQLTMPLGLMLAFIIMRRDTFAASVMLWWSGQNFIDVSPYIADARSRALPLIRGASEAYHDWGNLLSMTGTLEQTELYARCSFNVGVVLILLSLMWGGWLVMRQYQQLRKQQA